MRTKSDAQKENLRTLLKLIEENPDLDIVPMVDSEIVADDGFDWWVGGWGKAQIDEIWFGEERAYIRSNDEDSLVEDKCDDVQEDADGTMTEDEAYAKAVEIVKAYEWERCILVSITTP